MTVSFTIDRGIAYIPVSTPGPALLYERASLRNCLQMTDSKPSVLFVCVHNSGRSQMAAALLERAGGGRVAVRSAGSDPADSVNPAVVEAMAEVGIDVSQKLPKLLARDAVEAADVVVTMGCGDACPILPGKRYEDWELEDPSGRDVKSVRAIRDDISARVDALLAEIVSG